MSTPAGMSERRRIAETTAGILLEIGAILANTDQPFTFTSGSRSPVYVDIRKLIAFPRARARIMDMAVEVIGQEIGYESIDVIAGGETAGIPFAAWIADRMGLPMIYVRKQPKGFGRMAQIEGDLREGQRVLLVEDLASEGGSKIAFCNALRQAGAAVNHTLVVFHYGIFPESIARLREIDVRLHGLATWADAIDTAEVRGYFPPPVAAEVRRFLDDPRGWAADRGF
ncbi:MAG: orotate phosphoribosyltransferase [Alphaproteobacteria bacterium]